MKARAWVLALACVWAAGALAAPSFTVSSYQLVSQRRLSLTTYEYVYRATVQNAGTAATVVTARLSALPASLTAVDDNLAFGDVAAGATRLSTDTFAVRHNRTAGSFNAASLAWQFTFSDPNRGLLEGAVGAPAVAALKTFADETVDYTAEQIATLSDGSRVLRTSLLVLLDGSATVGEVNEALQAHGARITTMSAGVPQLVVRIPDPGSFPALQTLMSALEARPGIAKVLPSDVMKGDALPPNPPFVQEPPARLDAIGHQVAVRANGVWNLRERLNQAVVNGQMPELVIADFFGAGPPSSVRGFEVVATPSDYGTRVNDPRGAGHGYDVLSMIAASFGGSDDNEGYATGLVPVSIKVKAFDLQRLPSWDLRLRLADYLRTHARAGGRRLVVNLSFGTDADCRKRIQFIDVGGVLVPVSGQICDPPTAEQLFSNIVLGQTWLESLRGSRFFEPAAIAASPEPYFLQVSAAGNNHRYSALASSSYNYAAEPVLPLFDLAGNQQFASPGVPVSFPGLSNALRVEGRYGVVGDATVKPAPVCADSVTDPLDASWRAFSPGGDVSAIGGMVDMTLNGQTTGVFAPLARVGPSYKTGSSFATPQVAAAAMMIWAVAPTLDSAAVKAILQRTSGGLNAGACITEGDYELPLDAYGALLAADHPTFAGGLGSSATRTTAPVRLALLDVAGAEAGALAYTPDAKFTQADLLGFVREFQQRHGAQLDYSRFDLNGDGRTGEPTVVRQPATATIVDTAVGSQRFDLDGDGRIATATQNVEGIPIVFHEEDIDDISILIYYAYSPLYEGNEYERTLILLPYLEFGNESALLKPFLRSLTFNLSGLSATLTGNTVLGSILYQASATDTGDQFGTRFVSSCGVERGIALFSTDVEQAAADLPDAADVVSPTWWWSTATTNTAPPGANARERCSDFIAAVPGSGEMWVNITKFTSAEPTREYQMRLWLGRPDLAAGPAGRFEAPAGRLATQQGVFGFVDLTGPGFFVAGTPSTNFRLLGVGLQASASYLYQVRNTAAASPLATGAARTAAGATPTDIPRPVSRKRNPLRQINR